MFLVLVEDGEPTSYEEAMYGQSKNKWQEAMEEEMNFLKKNSTYDLVKFPKGKKALKNKWVFKIKHDESSD